MNKKVLVILAIAITLLFPLASCSKDGADSSAKAEPTEKEILLGRFSYTIGYGNAKYLMDTPDLLPDTGYLFRGIIDFENMEKEPMMTTDEMSAVYQKFVTTGGIKGAELGDDLDMKKIIKLKAPKTEHEKYSYAYGFILASNGIYQFGNMDFSSFIDGIRDALYENEPLMTPEEMEKSIPEYSAYVQKEYEETVGKEKKKNLEEADNFFRENATKDGVVVPNEYCQLKFNTNGPKTEKVELGDSVKLNYKLTNLQGEVLDQGNGVVFPMDTSQMIKGFVEGCIEMYVGDSATVYVHPEHGYGERGPNGIGPNRLLIFDIDILGIEK